MINMERLIKRFWLGEITLWRSYWLVGELLNALFILLISNFEIYVFGNNKFSNSLLFLDFSNFSLLSKLALIIWTVFITVGIWRSAENYNGNFLFNLINLVFGTNINWGFFWIAITLIFLSYRIFSLRLIFFG